MEKTLAIHLAEQREEIAQEIEKQKITWGSLDSGIPLHDACWKCGSQPVTHTCDTSRVHFGKRFIEYIARLVRDTK